MTSYYDLLTVKIYRHCHICIWPEKGRLYILCFLLQGASRTGTDIDMSELQELAGLEDDPYYTDLVDVQEIADVASVSEGSIMSFIDWDQVNDLIADVY